MKIIGTGSALPSLIITNDMLSKYLDTNDQWITSRTGIKKRRIISQESLIDLAVQSAQRALDNAGISAMDIDFIICSNVANNYVTPAMSCIIQGLIGATCPCIDLNGACAGFIYALDMAESYLSTGRSKNIMIVCAEEPTRFCNWEQRDTSVLFGDGAGTVIVSAEGNCFKSIYLTTTSKKDAIYYQRKLEETPYIHNNEVETPLVMHGKDVFKMAVYHSTQDIKTVIAQSHINSKDIHYYLLHQANMRIIDLIRQNLNESEEKFPSNIEKYGNTSSASIPILLDELNKENKINEGDLLVLSAFGAGFTTGACLFSWSKNNKKQHDDKN